MAPHSCCEYRGFGSFLASSLVRLIFLKIYPISLHTGIFPNEVLAHLINSYHLLFGASGITWMSSCQPLLWLCAVGTLYSALFQT